jgi:hypothetical protein
VFGPGFGHHYPDGVTERYKSSKKEKNGWSKKGKRKRRKKKRPKSEEGRVRM